MKMTNRTMIVACFLTLGLSSSLLASENELPENIKAPVVIDRKALCEQLKLELFSNQDYKSFVVQTIDIQPAVTLRSAVALENHKMDNTLKKSLYKK